MNMNIFRKIFRAEFVILGVITLVLIAAAFCIFTVTVKSSSGDDNGYWNEYYAPVEADYVGEVRGYLNELGYCNPGVTLTHVTDEDLMRTYTICIHHRRFENLSEERREELENAVLNMGFADDRCSILIELI